MKTIIVMLALFGFVLVLLVGFFMFVAFLSAFGLLADEDANSYIDEEFDK